MPIVSAGYSGTVNEAQWSRLFDAAPYWVDLAGGQVAAVANARSVSIADGAIFGRGVRDVLTGVANLVLAPPASGGLWYLIAARRTWGTGASTTVVAITGGTTDGTVPATPPTTLPTGAASSGSAGFQRSPGVVDDQPLAWVHVRAADTTLTLFDLRLQLTVAGDLCAQSVHALNFQALTGNVRAGSLMACADGFTYRWGGSTWRRWDSEWANGDNFGYQGTTQAPFARTGRYRMRGGRLLFQGTLTLSGGSLNASLVIGLPAGFTLDGYQSTLNGVVIAKNASDNYRGYWMGFQQNDATSIRIYTIGASGNASVPGYLNDLSVANNIPFNEAWGQSDQLQFAFDVDVT